MKIYVDRIPEEGLFLEEDEPVEILDIEDARVKFNENIHVKVRVYKVSGNLIVVGTLSTRVSYTCSCCLEVFNFPVESKKFSYDCEIASQDIIDLTDPIREDIIIGLPLRPLCREDCKGLCARCGKNLNMGKCRCKRESQPKGPFSHLDDLLKKK